MSLTHLNKTLEFSSGNAGPIEQYAFDDCKLFPIPHLDSVELLEIATGRPRQFGVEYCVDIALLPGS